MRSIYKTAMLATVITLTIACGNSAKEEKGDLTDKRAKLAKLKEDQGKMAADIAKLEDEIAKADPASVAAVPKLVSTTPVQPGKFTHYIDLQGMITTENIYYVSPRGMGGQVKAIYVKEGQKVSKGQLVVKLDDAIIRQQIDQAKIQLGFLQDLYNRRKNLWDQNIGTEVELISAKNNVVGQEKQISLLNEQLAMTNVYSEVTGVVEQLNLRVGETFSPGSAAQAGIRIVNNSNLKASVNIPENYLARVSKGTPVIIEVKDINKKFNSTISLISQVISTTNRSFNAEAKLPSDADLKPNQVAMVRIQDYTQKDAITVPLNAVQTDEKGKFVMIAAAENGKKIARKKPVQLGMLYNDQIEVKQGVQPGDEVITQGYQSIYEGQLVTTDVK
ncbi:MAG TPA: efflux RND transporter periplasmic adaptor subunit [Flavitalea sp.]|nr:efflux RND transporter periplasmic adaptor subunit [Flavitalea sp.]